MIGILDSGLGGLSFYLPLRKHSSCDILYVADQKHLPYGNKTKAELLSYLQNAVAFFSKKNADALVLACGTLSCTALPCIGRVPFPVFGVAEAGIDAVLQSKTARRVLLCATHATVQSGYFQTKLQKAGLSVLALPCAPFVHLAENRVCRKEADFVVKTCLNGAKDFQADTVLLGCTHFGFLKDSIQNALPHAMIIDCAEESANALLQTSFKEGQNKTVFYTTGDKDTFAMRLQMQLGTPQHAEYIDLENRGFSIWQNTAEAESTMPSQKNFPSP